MEKPVYAFYLSLFNLFIVYIVFANFLGWSGGAINITGYGDADWQNTYIGFESMRMMVNDFKVVLNSFGSRWFVDITIENFLKLMEGLLNAILAGLPNFLTQVAHGSVGWNEVLQFIVTMFLQPIIILAYVFLLLGFIFLWAFTAITILFKFFGGAYNLPFEENAEIWSQWSYLESEWPWEIMQVPCV